MNWQRRISSVKLPPLRRKKTSLQRAESTSAPTLTEADVPTTSRSVGVADLESDSCFDDDFKSTDESRSLGGQSSTIQQMIGGLLRRRKRRQNKYAVGQFPAVTPTEMLADNPTAPVRTLMPTVRDQMQRRCSEGWHRLMRSKRRNKKRSSARSNDGQQPTTGDEATTQHRDKQSDEDASSLDEESEEEIMDDGRRATASTENLIVISDAELSKIYMTNLERVGLA